MGPLRFFLNVLWFILGGVLGGIAWYLAGIIAAITVIGLPWARACFRIGNHTFFPFGSEVISIRELKGRESGTASFLRLLGNIIWFIPLGFILMVLHVMAAIACFITIIGIPFGWAHLKLAEASIFPLGKRIVPIAVANLARADSAASDLARFRR